MVVRVELNRCPETWHNRVTFAEAKRFVSQAIGHKHNNSQPEEKCNLTSSIPDRIVLSGGNSVFKRLVTELRALCF